MKRLLLLADIRDWAYDIIARNIAPYLDNYETTIFYVEDVVNRQRLVDFADFDVVFAFHWQQMARLGARYYRNYDPRKVVVGVHSESGLQDPVTGEIESILGGFAAVACTSLRLMNRLQALGPAYTPNGFDPSLFFPRPLPPITSDLKIMWVGNPDENRHGRNKGLSEILRPAIHNLPGVTLVTATLNARLDYRRMAEFYTAGHLYVCTSRSEGTPLPLLEALACGRPVITTDVGIVPEVVDSSCGKVIARDSRALRSALEALVADPAPLRAWAGAAPGRVQDRTWQACALSYLPLFDSVQTTVRKAARGVKVEAVQAREGQRYLTVLGPRSAQMTEFIARMEPLGFVVRILDLDVLEMHRQKLVTRFQIIRRCYWKLKFLQTNCIVLFDLDEVSGWLALLLGRSIVFVPSSVDVLSEGKGLRFGGSLLRSCFRLSALVVVENPSLFSRARSLGAEKIVAFNENTQDFTCVFSATCDRLSTEHKQNFVPLFIAMINVLREVKSWLRSKARRVLKRLLGGR